MASLNKLFLIGNLVRDPELRVTPKGTAICQGGIAVNRQFKDESGQSRDETTFVDWEAWSKTGELIAKYCTKGAPVLLEGRLKLDSWEDKTTGQKRSKLKMVVENVQFLGQRQAAAPGEDEPGSLGRAEPAGVREPIQSGFKGVDFSKRVASKPANPPKELDMDEDVPF